MFKLCYNGTVGVGPVAAQRDAFWHLSLYLRRVAERYLWIKFALQVISTRWQPT